MWHCSWPQASPCRIPRPAQDAPLYKDARQPLEVRVADLLGRMTLEEKVAQLQALWIKKSKIQDDAGNFSPEKATTVIPHGLGQIARPQRVERAGPPGAGRPRARRASTRSSPTPSRSG